MIILGLLQIVLLQLDDDYLHDVKDSIQMQLVDDFTSGLNCDYSNMINLQTSANVLVPHFQALVPQYK